jgi:hypothetical protein
MTTGPGDVVTFEAEGNTQAGIIIAEASTTPTWVVAYDFALPNGGQIVHCKETVTDTVTVVSSETD